METQDPQKLALAEIWTMLERSAPGPNAILSRMGGGLDAPVTGEFDILRTEVLQVLRRERWSRIGIVAPTKSSGASFTALNLACGLARVENFRTLLVDLNQRNPGLANLLDIPWKGHVSAFLAGHHPVSRYVRKLSETFGVVLNAGTASNAADILHSGTAQDIIDDTVEQLDPDVMIFDLPPMLEHDDFAAFAPTLDAVILVSDGTRTSAANILECERRMKGLVPLLGVVMNRAH